MARPRHAHDSALAPDLPCTKTAPPALQFQALPNGRRCDGRNRDPRHLNRNQPRGLIDSEIPLPKILTAEPLPNH
jgi:hypothetical protein